jgi:DNA-binding IscR family transcriptional regulator
LDATFDNVGVTWCNCEHGGCVSDNLWDGAKDALRSSLAKTTMQEVLEKAV